MPYLHSIFSEALRLNPPVPTDGKTVRKDDVLPSGLKIKGGEMAAFMPFAMGRHPELWGEDALEFIPERWLDGEGKFKRESPFKFSVFQVIIFLLLVVGFRRLKNATTLTLSSHTSFPQPGRSPPMLRHRFCLFGSKIDFGDDFATL